MAAQIVDELIVTLNLDSEPYEKAEARVERNTDRTFRKQQDRARVTDRTNKDQQRRLKDVSAGVKAFAGQVAAAVGVVTGLGVAVGGILTGFLGFETSLRRQTVATGLSNRQMQAWSATARRLGADAAAGAEAIAALARERQQIGLGMPAPTLAALGRLGVNVDPSRPLEDVLAQAQQIYRSAPEGQRQQYENTLAALGVSADLILMIKSERDAREAYTQSLAQATEENRKALDALADSLESMKATAISVTATLLEALQPAIEEGSARLSEFAKQVSTFTKDVQEAGGGVDGFQRALDKNVPTLGRLFEGFRLEGKLLSDATAVVTNRLRETGQAFGTLWERIIGWLNIARAPWGSKGVADDIRDRVRDAVGAGTGQTVGQKLALRTSDWWDSLAGRSRTRNAAAASGNPYNLPRNIEDDPPNRNPHNLPRNIEDDAPGSTGDAQQLMSKLITQYGLTTQQAAAVVANWVAESGLRADAYNPAEGGTGARGLAQWRGARTAAFRARYGVMPDQAPIDQQVEFAMTDPYERALMQKAFAAGSSASQLGRAYSKYYEAHSKVPEDIRRGHEAARLASAYGDASAGASVTIQNMTVQSNDPAGFVGGLQRLSGSQPYNTVIR